MKLNRLLEITTVLMNRGSVTARELAERFGVSTRTIYRDIDMLSASGVPVYASRGASGGISILEDYVLNRAVLTKGETQGILVALKSMQATRYPGIETVLEKVGALFGNTADDWIHIESTPWGSNPNAEERFGKIKGAILGTRHVSFDYINAQGIKGRRIIAPLRLVYKGQSWYLWGWCTERLDFRLFRISRIKTLAVCDSVFDRGSIMSGFRPGPVDTDRPVPVTPLELRFNERALYRLYDHYDDDDIEDNGDGTYTLRVGFPLDDWVIGYILGFGGDAEVVSPKHVRDAVRERAEKILADHSRI